MFLVVGAARSLGRRWLMAPSVAIGLRARPSRRGHDGSMDAPDNPFERLGVAWFLALDGPIALLVLAASWPAAGRLLHRVLPFARPSVVRALLVLTLLAHLGEGIAAGRKARAADLPWRPWAIQTTLLGLPSTLALRQAVASRSS